MRISLRSLIGIPLLTLGLAVACAPAEPAPQPSATPVPTATSTPIPEPTATATPPPPTATTAPTPRPAPVPGNTPQEIARGDPALAKVALTFDCGSVAGPSATILDVLKQYGIRVTIFMTGQYVDQYPDLVRRMVVEGHEMANHSYSHPNFTEMSDAAIVSELRRTEEAVKRTTEHSTKPYMRMPFGARNARVNQVVAGEGYTSIFWTLDSGDWLAEATTASVRERVLGRAGNGYIVVQHCAANQTAEALPAILDGLKAKGLQVVTISNLLGRAPVAREIDGNDLLAPLSKAQALPQGYVPPDLVELAGIAGSRGGIRLRREAYGALRDMMSETAQQGLQLQVASAYRSYDEQRVLFDYYVQRMGAEQASRISAEPGHSEHQLGTTVDFTSPSVGYDLTQGFAQTTEGRWLADNAHRFGFVLSYPESKEQITGYAYEPWHYRYVGQTAAAAVRARGVTLLEYLTSLSL